MNVDAVAGAAEDKTSSHGFSKASCLFASQHKVGHLAEFRIYLVADLLLIFAWKVDEVIVFGANQEWYRCLVEASPLSVPLLDTVQGGLAGEVEHEEDGNSVVANEG